jgi:hypothetical protein
LYSVQKPTICILTTRICNILPNKDHTTCGKEKFIANPDHRAAPLEVREQWLG